MTRRVSRARSTRPHPRGPCVVLGILVVAVGLTQTACGGDSSGTPTTTESTTIHVIGTDRDGAENVFDPDVLDMRAGETYTVELENTGSVAHTFTIRDWDVDTGLVNPGDSKRVELTVPAGAAGSRVEFVCVPDQALGMRGTIDVT